MVIKKDGKLQDLNPDKIKTSILNAASETVAIVNESDIKILVSDVVETIKNIRGENGNTSSYEITGILIDILRRDGFNNVVETYLASSGRD